MFDRERALYFPPERNFLASHVTLFHHLLGNELPALQADLAEAAGATPRFGVTVAGVRLLGRGVAYRLAAPELTRLRAGLAARWEAVLTRQDRQTFQPHVTVQNKVEPAEARVLHERLEAGFAPWQAEGIGLDLWEYRGGPWEPVRHFPFAAAAA